MRRTERNKLFPFPSAGRRRGSGFRTAGNIFFPNGWRAWLNLTRVNRLCSIQDVFDTFYED
ncbi:hypothetical protein HMPREF3038_02021 [Akkermansia sp. KLE1797]|nr:hypothetical protein HMPREF3038_02021 [Akkermansia sp. KLE1797]